MIQFFNSLQIVQGPAGKKKGIVRPFQNLNCKEILTELMVRDSKLNSLEKTNKKHLQNHLKLMMKGIIRTPAMSYNNETKSMEELSLEHYEVSPIEPLHDIKGHIKNLWCVLPHVLDHGLKKEFQSVLKSCFDSKGKIRGSDYRLSLLITYNTLKNKFNEDVKELLETLIEICHGAYCKASSRSSRSVLRLFNVTFKHALICKRLANSCKEFKKIFGTYYHSIITHLPEVARIISPSSLHTENEERLFSDLNNISTTTSSRRHESVRDNSILRLQLEMQWRSNNQNGSLSKMKDSISKISHFSKEGESIVFSHFSFPISILIIVFFERYNFIA